MHARPSTPRILPPQEPSPDVSQVLANAAGHPGENLLGALANHERALFGFMTFGQSLTKSGIIAPRAREIVILRVGWNCRAVYEFGHHTVAGLEAGLTDDEVRSLAGGSLDGFTAGERGLIALVDELCADDCVSDETWAQLASTWSPTQLVELVLLTGLFRMVSGFLNSAGVQREPGIPGWPGG
jgi:4-carboxymuconolactone decarboxylase